MRKIIARHAAGNPTRGVRIVRSPAVVLTLLLLGSMGVVMAQGPVGGANVNVISGTGADGDWTLQRQNEPSMGCSSRNPNHCLAGANDYRTVDIPFPADANRVTGDAWLGYYTTKDGGLTWHTRLLPGFPQDVSAEGATSPLRFYSAGADPTIRPGTNGLFYYSGIVFNREEGGASAVFVARFIDNNNQEGTAGEPIAYLGATIVDSAGVTGQVAQRDLRNGRIARAGVAAVARGRERVEEREREREKERGRAAGKSIAAGGGRQTTTTPELDKPWVAVDIPRAGAQTCTIGGPGTNVPAQSFPGGRVYVVYTIFDGGEESQRGRVVFSRSLDCGRTWSAPRTISRIPSADVNDDGVANTTDVNLLRASLGRSCGQVGYNSFADTNNDCIVNAYDLNFVSRGVGRPVPTQPRLSQGATLAINPVTGALQVAWRQFNDGTMPDAVITVRSNDAGTSFTAPTLVSLVNRFDQGSSDTSFRTNGFPTMAMDGTGRAYLAWSMRGIAANQSDPANGDARVVISTSTNGTTWSAPRAADNQPPYGHQIMPALTFAQGKLQLVYYDLREDESQLFGPYVDELPILTGPSPRVRHTMEVRAAQADPGDNPVFTSIRLTKYQTGSVPGSNTIRQLQFNPPNLPLFRAGTTPFMGDYIDTASSTPFVRNGSSWSFNTEGSSNPLFHAIWTDNRDVRPPANGNWTAYTPPNPPFARPTMSGFDPTVPLPACVPGQAGMRNQNIYTARITEGLAVGALSNAKQLGSIQRSFPVFAQNNSALIRTYRLTIANQPVGGEASFRQFSQITTLDVRVPPRSTIARTVFARSSDPHAQINVSVVEIAAVNGAPVPNGQHGTIVLNGDPSNPDIENPDIENPDIENPDIENREAYNPDIENAAVRNPDIENPDIENPDIENPDIENVNVANPTILNPDIENPDIENPDIENPDIENPDIENSDLVNGSLSDTTWVVTNKGNAAGSFTVKLALNRAVPAGFKSQLIAHKVYKTPVTLGCELLQQPQTVLLANIPNPTFVAAGELVNPDIENPDIENLTIALGPGETARITLRVLDPNRFDAVTFRPAESVAPAVVSQSVNTEQAQQGVTQPPAAGVLTSNAPVSGGAAGGPYSTTLGSVGTGVWTVVGGALPPGTALNGETGVISGTPTVPGTYVITLRFDSTTGLTDFRTITIDVAATPAANADLSISSTTPASVAVGANAAFILTARNLGPALATNVVVTDTLPSGATFVSATTSQGTCTHSNGTVICTLGPLAANSTVPIVLTVHLNVGGLHVNSASIAGTQADPVVANNSVQASATAGSSFAPCTTTCFSGPSSFLAGTSDAAFAIDKADFNEDGRLDVVYSAANDTDVTIFFGNGSGGFGTPVPLHTPGIPGLVHAADFNRDGHQDLLVGEHNLTHALLYLGNGNGTFGSPLNVEAGVDTGGFGVGDFNNDGRLDIGFGDEDRLVITFGNGDGTFQAPVQVPGITDIEDGTVGDFNGDGSLDIAISHRTANAVTVLFGNGAGGFPTTTTLTTGDIEFIRAVGDLNHDGRDDLVIFDTFSGATRLRVFLANADGFATPTDLPLTIGGVTYTASADIDGDGDLDLLLSGRSLKVYLNNGDGTFSDPIAFGAFPSTYLLTGDFNGDGAPDVALASQNPGRLVVLLNTCNQSPADLSLTIGGGSEVPVAEGGTVSHTFAVTNNGPNPATGVQLTASVTNNGLITSATPAQGTCSEFRGVVTCLLETIEPGGTVTISSNVRAQAGGTLIYFGGVNALTSDPNPRNNAQTLSTTITPGASTFVVTTTNDTGPGSLRQALIYANADGGPADTITFNIPGGGVHTLRPPKLFDLPIIRQPVIIDGTSQPGYTGTPLVEISGENADQTSGLIIQSNSVTVRGLAINRFPLVGIFVPFGTGNIIQGNFIGLRPDGTAAPNGHGIEIDSLNNTVGGVQPADRNVISGNTGTGVILFGSSATGNIVNGNYIGTDPAGSSPLPNGTGGVFISGSRNTLQGNTIAFNGASGVFVNSGTGNGILSNTIHSNAGLGIDLAPAGVTPNDPGDADTGPNNLLNAPILNSATLSGGNVAFRMTLNRFPGPDTAGSVVHVYANTTCDPSGSGEGQRPLAVITLGGQNTGDTEINTTLTGVAAGEFLTATRTDNANNTSEFSACVQVVAQAANADLSLTKSDLPDPAAAGSNLTYTLTVHNNGPDTAAGVTVVDTLPAGVTFVSANASQGTCSGTSTVTCSLGSIANGADVTVSIVVTPTAIGGLTNTATVSTTSNDPTAGNNTASTGTTVVGGPSSFVVTNTNDNGAGSFRQTILNANASPGADVITFAIPGSGAHTITPASQLPTITEAVTIDGTSQPGWSGPPLIELNGINAGPTANGLVITGNSTTVRGLSINRFGTGGSPTAAGGAGIVLQGAGSHRIQMNYIGPNPAGTGAFPNRTDGIFVDNSPNNLIGGTSPFGNILSGNTRSGLRLNGSSTLGTIVAGNQIGTSGANMMPNGEGVTIVDSPSNTISGTGGLDPNVISSNLASGIAIQGAEARFNVISRNFIGTDLAGTANLGNGGDGVLVTQGASDTFIGATSGLNGNTIRFNALAGVRIDDGLRNAVLFNVIANNGGLGIDLGPIGVTPNDTRDVDAGANNLQNFPAFTRALTNGTGSFHLEGTLNSTPNSLFTVQLYLGSACDASGFGEGLTRLESIADVPTDASGNAVISIDRNYLIASGQVVTATATDAQNNTSEFSACVPVTLDDRQANLGLTNVDSPDPVGIGSSLFYTLTVTNAGPDAAAGVSVVDTLSEAVTFISATPSQGVCSGAGPVTCSLGTISDQGQATITISVATNSIGNVANSATVTSTTADPSAANNTATASTTVVNAPQTFVVTNTADSGIGSLRAAIIGINGNTNAGGTIAFNIPGAGPFTITPASPLPTITEPVSIDGASQPGFVSAPLIEINGTDAGTNADGLRLNASNSLVRGLVINRFSGSGVVLLAGTTSVVAGNYLGTNAAGTAAAGNAYGITVLSSGNTIGGFSADTRNLISGNHQSGIRLGANALSNSVTGNYIGTDVTGMLDVGNEQAGVLILGQSNIIGQLVAAGRNIISGNDQAGVLIDGGATSNTIAGNYIGTTVTGTAARPNGIGVRFLSGSTNVVGGTSAPYANTIAFNTGAGVAVESGTNNTILGNRIDRNGGLGIDLNNDGVTPNDIGDGDEGPNDRTNFPVLTAVAGGVQGTLDSTPFSGFFVELFTVPACDGSGNGEGAALLASGISVSSDEAGHAVIPFTAAPAGAFVTATATDGSGNTSEFSACARVPQAIVLSLPNSLPIGIGRDVTATVTLPTPAPAGGSVVSITSANPSIASIPAPGTVTIAQGQTTGTFTIHGVETGTVAIRANATGYLQGTMNVTVTPNLVSTPSTLSVAFGQTTALPVSIGPNPAPAGGLTLDVVSADPATIEVVTPQITIAQGAFSANATVRGVLVGTAAVTVSNPSYSPSTTTVTSSAELSILQTSASFNNGLPPPAITVRLETAGSPVAARPALTVNLTSANTACVTVPATVTIPEGLVSTTFQPAYGGTATLPCTTTVTSSAPSLTSDSVTITVNTAPIINGSAPSTIGAGLMVYAYAFLGASQHGGRVVTIQSDDTSRFLVSPDPSTAGMTSFTRTLANGETSVNYYVHALENVTGTATISLSAPGFTGATQQVTAQASGIEIIGLNTSTTPFTAPDTAFYVQVGIPCGGNTQLCAIQNRRAGGPAFIVTLSNSSANVARLRSDEPAATGQSVTKPIQPGTYYTQAAVPGTSYGLTFEPLANGTTTVSITGPPGVLTMSTTGHRDVGVSSPAINAPGNTTVGAGLMVSSGASLGAAQHGGVVVTIQSSDSTRVLVSPDNTTAGVASFTRTIANGQSSVPYYVHGHENMTGSATVTISAPGFSSDSHTVTLAPIGVEIIGLNTSTTTLSPPGTSFYVQVGLPCAGNGQLCSVQSIRAGAPAFVVTLTSETPSVGRLRSDEPVASGQTVTKPIQPGTYYTQALTMGTSYGLTFEPLANGTTFVNVAGPAGVATMTSTGRRQVTVSAPVISGPGNATVGAGLMYPTGGSLGASQHGGVTVTVQSNDPTRVLVSPDAATAGAASFNTTLANGQTSIPYYVHGVENMTGSATVTISAPAFTSASHTVTLAPIGVEIVGLTTSTTSLSVDDRSWYVQAGLPCAGNAQLCTVQNLRAGGPPFIVTLRNSNATVARLHSDEPVATGQTVTKPIRAGSYYTQAALTGTSYGLAFEPLANGSTVVSVTGPTGVLTMSSTGARTVTVSTPGISISSTATVGAGLQIAESGTLGASEHGGVDVTITSSAPSVVRVSPNATTTGTASIAVPVANNSSSFNFYVQGMEGASGTAVITISAPGFTSSQITVTVEPAAIAILNLNTSMSATSQDDTTWYVEIGLANSTGAFITTPQNVRAGSPGVVITLTNSNASAARLGSDEPAALGQMVTKPIQPGLYYTQAIVPGTSYGLRFDPMAAGTTTVTASGPAGVMQTTAAVKTVTINP